MHYENMALLGRYHNKHLIIFSKCHSWVDVEMQKNFYKIQEKLFHLCLNKFDDLNDAGRPKDIL